MDLLSQDEIDALLHGADSIPETKQVEKVGSEAVAFDLSSQDRIVRGRMPTLELINERFTRYMRISVFNMLRKPAEISMRSVQILKFGEYQSSLFVPTSLSMVRFRPLTGTALVTMEAKLVFSLVENFFGGDGRFHTRIEGREFTLTEKRIVNLLLNLIFEDYQNAWLPVMKTQFQYLDSDVNPAMATIVSQSEVVILSSFHLDLNGGGGDFHIVMPYSMIEPIRELLDAGIQGNKVDTDIRWSKALQDEVMDVGVNFNVKLLDVTLPLHDIMQLRAGDVIPIKMPEECTAYVESLPSYRGKLGQANDNIAIKITQQLERPETNKSDLVLLDGENTFNAIKHESHEDEVDSDL